MAGYVIAQARHEQHCRGLIGFHAGPVRTDTGIHFGIGLLTQAIEARPINYPPAGNPLVTGKRAVVIRQPSRDIAFAVEMR